MVMEKFLAKRKFSWSPTVRTKVSLLFFRTAERTETVVVVVTGCDFVVLSRILRSQKLRAKFDSQVVSPKYHG